MSSYSRLGSTASATSNPTAKGTSPLLTAVTQRRHQHHTTNSNSSSENKPTIADDHSLDFLKAMTIEFADGAVVVVAPTAAQMIEAPKDGSFDCSGHFGHGSRPPSSLGPYDRLGASNHAEPLNREDSHHRMDLHDVATVNHQGLSHADQPAKHGQHVSARSKDDRSIQSTEE
ncbi:hypothetical protein BGX24_008940 [Mortierella sp. AD032]|nr:hypothetical protein BGX24_008940 [Mortierella sp. AD032]